MADVPATVNYLAPGSARNRLYVAPRRDEFYTGEATAFFYRPSTDG